MSEKMPKDLFLHGIPFRIKEGVKFCVRVLGKDRRDKAIKQEDITDTSFIFYGD